MFHHNTNGGRVLNRFKHLDDPWVVQSLQDFDLSEDLLLSLQVLQFQFLVLLYCHFLLRWLVESLKNDCAPEPICLPNVYMLMSEQLEEENSAFGLMGKSLMVVVDCLACSDSINMFLPMCSCFFMFMSQ
jgi:hypothetical protein